MKRVLLLVPIILTLVGCSTLAPYEKPQKLLSRAIPPIVVISVGDESILVRDGKNRFFTLSGAEFESLRPGDFLRK